MYRGLFVVFRESKLRAIRNVNLRRPFEVCLSLYGRIFFFQIFPIYDHFLYLYLIEFRGFDQNRKYFFF